MSLESVPISVEYLITTTSDWTEFQIIEGGWWIVKDYRIEEGFDRLTQEILYNEKTLVISKKEFDTSKVVVRLNCTLNIIKEYSKSNLTYLITKGNIESTVIWVFAEGKEILPPLVNEGTVSDNPSNPRPFESHVKYYLQALQEKRKVIEKQKRKIRNSKSLEMGLRRI